MKDYGYKAGDMKAHVMDYAKKQDAYSQKYDQAPLSYVERQDRMLGKEAAKLRKQAYKGRYDK